MTSGSLLRGHLRPAGARHPPFLVIGLVLIIVILAFNYWNLNGEYQAITKEIDELQDNLHMAMLKKDNAERQYEVYEKRFRETDAKLGKEKMAAEHKDSQIAQAAEKLEAKADEVNKLQEQLNLCQQSNGKLETSSKQLEEMQARFKALEAEKEELARENEKMVTVIRDLKIKQEEMAFHQASLGLVHTGSNPVLRGALLNGSSVQDIVTNPSKLSSNEINRLDLDTKHAKQQLPLNETNHEGDVHGHHETLDENAANEETEAENNDKIVLSEKKKSITLEAKRDDKLETPEKPNDTNLKHLPNPNTNLNEGVNATENIHIQGLKDDGGVDLGGQQNNQDEDKLDEKSALKNQEMGQDNVKDQPSEIQPQAGKEANGPDGAMDQAGDNTAKAEVLSRVQVDQDDAENSIKANLPQDEGLKLQPNQEQNAVEINNVEPQEPVLFKPHDNAPLALPADPQKQPNVPIENANFINNDKLSKR